MKKSGQKSGRQRPGTFTGKNDPRNGRGPKRGAPNAGRPPDWFREAMRGIASREDVLKRLTLLTSAKNTNDGLFLRAFEVAAEWGYGRGMQPEISFPIDPKGLTDEQLQRVANGEDPLLVLATSRQEGA